MRLRNREEAGKRLAKQLMPYTGRPDVRLFALPRGGVVLGKEIAEALRLPLDVIITRKIATSRDEEYAIGALSETGTCIWNEEEKSRMSGSETDAILAKAQQEVSRRIRTYRHGRPLPDLTGLIAVIIDDGLATGLTMRAAVSAARNRGASGIIIAVPHGARDSLDRLESNVDEIVALARPTPYMAVGEYYDEFPQVDDEEVLSILKRYGAKN